MAEHDPEKARYLLPLDGCSPFLGVVRTLGAIGYGLTIEVVPAYMDDQGVVKVGEASREPELFIVEVSPTNSVLERIIREEVSRSHMAPLN